MLFIGDFKYTAIIEKQSLAPLNKMLAELGGWPVLIGPKWNSSSFDWMGSIHKLQKLGFPSNQFLRLEILPDRKNNTKRVIHVSIRILVIHSNLTNLVISLTINKLLNIINIDVGLSSINSNK